MPTPTEKTTATPKSLGAGITVKTGNSVVRVSDPKAAAIKEKAPARPGIRPGYAGTAEPASAPDVLDFEQTDIVMMNLPEDEFRQHIVDALKQLDDLGLNRDRGESRAQAYLDMVTWDAKNRQTYTNDNTGNTSSCGMFIRDVWWLCGARGTNLMDAPYVSGIITDLIALESKAKNSFNSKTFHPVPGDVIYLYKDIPLFEKDGSPKLGKNGKQLHEYKQHIFTIIAIDKTITDENGVATVRNGDGSLATDIAFTSVDGGQSDGMGHDGNGKSGVNWGCQGTKTVVRKMKLNQGHFPNLANGWPFLDGTLGRPLNTWLSIYKAKDHFTAPLIKPIRKSRDAATTTHASGEAEESHPETQHASVEDKRSDMDIFVAENQGRSMADLLVTLSSLSYAELKDIRDWYANPSNPKHEKFGPRPRVAMDAVLHKGEGDGSAWILSEAKSAGISPNEHSDQYRLLADKLGIHPESSGNIA